MSKISRAQVFQALTGSVTPESAEHLFRQSLQAVGLPDREAYTPTEVQAISDAMMELALRMLEEAEQEAFAADFLGTGLEELPQG